MPTYTKLVEQLVTAKHDILSTVVVYRFQKICRAVVRVFVHDGRNDGLITRPDQTSVHLQNHQRESYQDKVDCLSHLYFDQLPMSLKRDLK